MSKENISEEEFEKKTNTIDLTINQIDEIYKIQNNEEWCHLRKTFETAKIIGVIDLDKNYSENMTIKEYFKLIGKNGI